LAAATVVKRRGQQSVLEVIRRVETLHDEACREFSHSPERFQVALEEAISKLDDDTRNAAVTFICRTGNVEQFGMLLDQLESSDDSFREIVAEAVFDLAGRLSQRIRSKDETLLPHLDQSSLNIHRAAMLNELDQRLHRYEALTNPLPLLKSLLILGGPDDTAIRNVFNKRGESCRCAAQKLLSEDSHPALFGLLGDFLTHHAPPVTVMDAIRARNDFEFVLHFLSHLPKKPSGHLALNLAKLTDLAWLQDSMDLLEQLPVSVHDRLVVVINHAPLKEETRLKLKTWIVRHSGAEAREAANDVLKELPAEEASQILYDGLASSDPQVEAWATRRLRAQKLPDTFEELVKRLDRNLDVVRDAARNELFSFDLDYLLQIFGDLSPGQSRQCGQTLLKINPNALAELIGEITHPFRRRRIRAIEAAEALGFVNRILPNLLNALSDPEPSVRCAVVEALVKNPSIEAIEAIRKLTDDENRHVRSSVETVLANLSNVLKSANAGFATQVQTQAVN